MIGLGVECTAHTLGIGIVKDGKILSNESETYVTNKGGIIPVEAAKHHEKVFDNVLERALKKSKITLYDLNFIAVSIGPGLPPCLLAGLKKTKILCVKYKLPLVEVNHCIAHLEVGKIAGANMNPEAGSPVMLYVSGANTQIIAYENGKYRIFGETLDVGVGNFIDNFARYAGIGFPGGPTIEKLAGKSKNYIELPYKIKGMDIALSGILTNLKQKLEKKHKLNDLAYSMQETVFAMLVETAERALAHTGKKQLLLGGGVACNSRLQEMCKIMCKERGAKLFVPEKQFLQDNGAMISYTGEIMFNKKIFEKNLDKIDIRPRERTDDILVKWK